VYSFENNHLQTMILVKRYFELLLLAVSLSSSSAWISSGKKDAPKLQMDESLDGSSSSSSRRNFLNVGITATSSMLLFPDSSDAVRAIGGAEEDCRAAGNCLEIGEWDGALGWTWGGKDRCDATDPKCGPDGKLRDSAPSGESVPTISNKITQVVAISFDIGRTETAVIRLGLYGEDAPASVEQFFQFVTRGLRTTSDLVFENGMGVQATPVSLLTGGILGQIVPGQRIDFGIPSQSAAFARSRGMSKAGDNFMAQPRPKELNDPVIRKHDAAGLLSVPGKGIGYGGSGFESDDECFESSFQITAGPVPAMDKEGRKVIGQILDQESMNNLARLVSLPTKKGFKGVIPGQNSGPPLLKVSLRDVSVGTIENRQTKA